MWLFKSPDELPHSFPLTSWQVTQRQSLPRTAFQLTYPWECSVLQPALHSQCRECPAELTWAVRCELTPVFPCTCFYWIKLMCEAGWLLLPKETAFIARICRGRWRIANETSPNTYTSEEAIEPVLCKYEWMLLGEWAEKSPAGMLSVKCVMWMHLLLRMEAKPVSLVG